MQIPRKYQRLITSIISVLVFSGVISLGMVVARVGFVSDFLSIWLKGWVTAYLVAFPTIWFLAPLIGKWVAKTIPFKD